MLHNMNADQDQYLYSLFISLVYSKCAFTVSHQKLNYFFAWPTPMKSQRTDARGCDRRNIFPGGAFGVTRCGRRIYSGAFSAAQFSPRVEIFQLWGGHLATRANQFLCSALVALEGASRRSWWEHGKRRSDFSCRPKRVSLLTWPFAVFSPWASRRSARGGAYLRVSST